MLCARRNCNLLTLNKYNIFLAGRRGKMVAITDVKNLYADVMKKGDIRVNDWPMMSSPWPCIFILIAYLIFIKMGPTIMKGRQPMELKYVLIVYNVGMVVLSGYTGFQFLIRGYIIGKYSLRCQPVDYSDYPNSVAIARLMWLFFISKLLELLDTVFFVLRKKFSQVSFLHLSHHFVMPFLMWLGCKFVPGGISIFFPTLNSFVHLFMYSYYGLAALGPQYQKYLWWKKYMTKMQLIQFGLMNIHAAQLFFIECDYPIVFTLLLTIGSMIFMALFANFYIKSYLHKKE